MTKHTFHNVHIHIYISEKSLDLQYKSMNTLKGFYLEKRVTNVLIFTFQ